MTPRDRDLPDAISDMMANYRYDRDAVLRFLAATKLESVEINLYRDLLKKSNRVDPIGRTDGTNSADQMGRLAVYTLNRIEDEAVTAA